MIRGTPFANWLFTRASTKAAPLCASTRRFSTAKGPPPSFVPLTARQKQLLLKKYPDKIVQGKALATRIREKLASRILSKSSSYERPVLGHIIVGDLAQSELYVRLKIKACEEVVTLLHLPPEDPAARLAARVSPSMS